MPIGEILSNLGSSFVNIVKPMFIDPSLIWFLGPIFLFWFIFEVYFSRYKKEELGWNTALGNGLSVFWILIISIKYLFEEHMKNFEWSKFIALVIIMLYSIFIIINSFSHRLKEKVSFLLASPTITYYLSGVAVLWTYGKLEITIWVLIDLIIFYGFVLLVELVLKKIIKGKEGIGDIGLGKDEFKESDLGTGNLGGFGRI